MATLVGTQANFEDAIFELCELDYDAVEAYEAAINRLENKNFIHKMQQFKKDHQRHIQELSDLLQKHQIEAPAGPSAKHLLTQGKVMLANISGDEAILKAMLSNEIDTNTAYERVIRHEGLWKDSDSILNRGFEDEKRHKQWLQETIENFK